MWWLRQTSQVAAAKLILYYLCHKKIREECPNLQFLKCWWKWVIGDKNRYELFVIFICLSLILEHVLFPSVSAPASHFSVSYTSFVDALVREFTWRKFRSELFFVGLSQLSSVMHLSLYHEIKNEVLIEQKFTIDVPLWFGSYWIALMLIFS